MFKLRNLVVSYRQSIKYFCVNNLYNQKLLLKNYSVTFAYMHDLAIKKEVSKQNTQPVNKFVSRSHTCGELKVQNVGDNVHLYGWLEFSRMNKFMTLRDSYGITQLLVPDDRKDLQEIVKNLTYESVISVIGTVKERPKGQENKLMKTGYIEVYVESIKILNLAKPNLPLFVREFNKAKESTQMKHRYLSLRYPELQRNLRLRSKVVNKMRDYLTKECDFVDIETPTLFKNTPGGAQEFIVPTQHPGLFYSLVQSPQQFKQLLMVGGFDRYFQVARCYRDETVRHDRQPEFTQLDIEMSFIDCEGIMALIENLLVYSWPEESEGITSPFKRLTYNEAMECYGTDKPDLRIKEQLNNLTKVIDHSALQQIWKMKWEDDHEVYALVFRNRHIFLTKSAKENISKIQHDHFPSVKLIQMKINREASNDLCSLIMNGDVQQKLNLNEGDVVFLACGNKFHTESLLGRLRLEFTDLLENKGQTIRTSGNELLWITDFPLFSFNTEENKLETMHHPFTQPHPNDIQYLPDDPIKVRGLHYDLVLNGSEIGGGSIRIHDAILQKQILNMLNIDESHLAHMLDALECGAPPHGGIALGLDRLIALICKTKSIKSVIAFPKTMEGRDLMSGAPVPISDKEKMLYRIETVDK